MTFLTIRKETLLKRTSSIFALVLFQKYPIYKYLQYIFICRMVLKNAENFSLPRPILFVGYDLNPNKWISPLFLKLDVFEKFQSPLAIFFN